MALGRKFWQEQREYDRKAAEEKHADFAVEMMGNLEVQTWTEGDRPFVRTYRGKSGKREDYCYFVSLKQRDEYLQRRRDAEKRNEEYKAKRKAERKAASAGLKVGDILSSMWGYDQTNVDFYEVVEVTASGKSVYLQKIGSSVVEQNGWLSYQVVPNREERIGKPFRKVARDGYVSLTSYSGASKWSGRPVTETHYA